MKWNCPQGFKRSFDFSGIEIKGNFAYCRSHNFIFDPEIEKQKLCNGQACIYTDARYDSDYYGNSYKHAFIHWGRHERKLSLKACLRRTLKCRNIPVGTVVNFTKNYYFEGKDFDGGFNFKVKKQNWFDPKYEINLPEYKAVFNDAPNELVERLRSEGFLVQVFNRNVGWLIGNFDGEIAFAYGHGKKIGFSTGNNSFRGYYEGIENILWDRYDEFDKWSRCQTIPKEKQIDEIIQILKS